jgi:hypothetical protein
LQNFNFATATVKKCSFAARRAKNCKSLCKSNRLLQQALPKTKKQEKNSMNMKKVLFAVLVISVLAAAGCQTTGSGNAGGGGESEVKTEQSAEKVFENVYDRYEGDLILDGAQTYTVVKGDSLNGISRAKYNNGYYYPIIMLASRDVVVDPDRIEPGMQLTIPDLEKNLNDSKARASIKRFLPEMAVIEDMRADSAPSKDKAAVRHATAKGLRDLADTM